MQLDLFTTTPISRPTDPSTSHESAAEVMPRLNDLQIKALAGYSRWEERTANEAAAICAKASGGCHESYRKRKAELQRMGLIRCVGKRKCGVTGRNAEVFEVVK